MARARPQRPSSVVRYYEPRSVMVIRSVLALMTLMAAFGSTGIAQHWPHWRGPAHNGVSTETRLPETWSAACAPATPVGVDIVEGGPSASDDMAPAQRPQRPAGSNFEGRPLVPTVCANI